MNKVSSPLYLKKKKEETQMTLVTLVLTQYQSLIIAADLYANRLIRDMHRDFLANILFDRSYWSSRPDARFYFRFRHDCRLCALGELFALSLTYYGCVFRLTRTRMLLRSLKLIDESEQNEWNSLLSSRSAVHQTITQSGRGGTLALGLDNNQSVGGEVGFDFWKMFLRYYLTKHA